MINKETLLFAIDNSGAISVKCIGFFRGSGKNKASLGNIIKVSVQSLRKKGSIRVKKGQVLNALITNVKKDIGSSLRINGFSKTFDINGVVLLNNLNKMIGTRLLFPVDGFLRKNLNLKSILINYIFL